jgi:twitching motility two-component system response regulator PilH
MGSILIIDDDQTYRNKLAALASPTGRLVQTVDGGKAGLAKAKEMKPSLILLDVVMPGPGNDGFSCLTALRADPSLKSAAIVMVTTKSGAIDKQFATRLHATDYLVKPFQDSEVASILAKYQ